MKKRYLWSLLILIPVIAAALFFSGIFSSGDSNGPGPAGQAGDQGEQGAQGKIGNSGDSYMIIGNKIITISYDANGNPVSNIISMDTFDFGNGIYTFTLYGTKYIYGNQNLKEYILTPFPDNAEYEYIVFNDCFYIFNNGDLCSSLYSNTVTEDSTGTEFQYLRFQTADAEYFCIVENDNIIKTVNIGTDLLSIAPNFMCFEYHDFVFIFSYNNYVEHYVFDKILVAEQVGDIKIFDWNTDTAIIGANEIDWVVWQDQNSSNYFNSSLTDIGIKFFVYNNQAYVFDYNLGNSGGYVNQSFDFIQSTDNDGEQDINYSCFMYKGYVFILLEETKALDFISVLYEFDGLSFFVNWNYFVFDGTEIYPAEYFATDHFGFSAYFWGIVYDGFAYVWSSNATVLKNPLYEIQVVDNEFTFDIYTFQFDGTAWQQI